MPKNRAKQSGQIKRGAKAPLFFYCFIFFISKYENIPHKQNPAKPASCWILSLSQILPDKPVYEKFQCLSKYLSKFSYLDIKNNQNKKKKESLF